MRVPLPAAMITMFSAMRFLCSSRVATGPSSGRRIIAGLWLAACLGLVGGCSAVRLTYAQAPELAYWWADSYLDFNREQKPLVKAALHRLQAWQRSTQLPAVAGQLRRLQAVWREPVSAGQACEWAGQVRRWADEIVEQALPDAAALAVTLRPEQLEHLSRKMQKQRQDFAERQLDVPAAQRREEATDKLAGRYERVFGSLTSVQRQAVAEAVAAMDDPLRVDAEQRRRQQDLLATLQQIVRERDTPAAAQGRLKALAGRWRQASPDTIAWREQVEQRQCALLAQLHASATPAQRAAGAEQLADWEADARSLAGAVARVGGDAVIGSR